MEMFLKTGQPLDLWRWRLEIDQQGVLYKLSRGSYVDDSSGGGTTEDVDYLIGKVSVNNDGMYSYNGTVAQKLG